MGTIGVDIRQFSKSGKYTDQEVRKVADNLANDGEIYSTTDEYHFQHFENSWNIFGHG